ncbi:unnamed protein product [Prunus armeniaca]
MVIGIPQINCPSQVCEESVVGKHNQDQFPKGKEWRASNPLELIHSNICGPINLEKSKALTAFKSFKALAENETRRTIKVFRSDRGGEYNSKDFESFCALHGIRK